MPEPTLAAITLDQTGGGVAAVSRLIWSVMGEAWGDSRRLIELTHTAGGREPGRPGLASRARFGARLGALELSRPDSWIFFSHLSLARAQALVPAALCRPYAVFLHGIEAWRPLSDAERGILRRASLRVANSQYTANRVALANPGIGEIATCPLALAPDELPERVPPPAADQPTVLLVGRMAAGERYKGHDALLDAWPRIAAAVPAARLVFAGDGDDRARLREKAAALGLGDRVAFPGFVSPDGLADLYSRAAIFAMPSRGEGFGLVYLEAMAYGLPCVGSIHDAAREVIEDEVTGCLVDQADIAVIADRIIHLLTDQAARARMGAAGRRRVEARFTYARFSHRLVDLINRALEARLPALPSVSRAID
ncbi:MAG: glycosyltransferase family 4 protein [Vicinamibacterales bacterium]